MKARFSVLATYLSVDEAAEVAEVSTDTIRRALKASSLPADQPGPPWGKGWRIRSSDLSAWMRHSKNPKWRSVAAVDFPLVPMKGEILDHFRVDTSTTLHFDARDHSPDTWVFRLPENANRPPIGEEVHIRIGDYRVVRGVVVEATEMDRQLFGDRAVRVRATQETLEDLTLGASDKPWQEKTPEDIRDDIEALVQARELFSKKKETP